LKKATILILERFNRIPVIPEALIVAIAELFPWGPPRLPVQSRKLAIFAMALTKKPLAS
jgi:hypothetical protein